MQKNIILLLTCFTLFIIYPMHAQDCSQNTNPYFFEKKIQNFEPYEWKEYPLYPNELFISCYLFQSSETWWDTQCIYYRKDRQTILFYKNIITAFDKSDGINADGTLFNPTEFLSNPNQKFICKKENYCFNYDCISNGEK